MNINNINKNFNYIKLINFNSSNSSYLFFIHNSHLHTTSLKCLSNKNYYEVLNIPRNASRKEIKMAFYKLSKQFHPDINNDDNAEEKFKSIQEAYQILGDERKKIEYDMSSSQGYYDGMSERMRSTAAGAAQWRKRTSGPAYTGRTTAYDFDEHFKSHYYRPRSHIKYTSGPTYSSTRKSYEDELNDYWNTKEFSTHDQTREYRNKLISKSLYFMIILFLFSLYLQWSIMKESERGLKVFHNQKAKSNTDDK